MARRTVPTLLACFTFVVFVPTAPCEAGKEQKEQVAKAASLVPIEKLPKDYQPQVGDILKKPAIFCRGEVESFPCCPAVYDWLLDHPQHNVKAWQAVGAKCASVDKKEDGTYFAVDPSGSELKWYPVLVEPNRRIWYIEGTGKPATLLPSLTVKAVLVLHYEQIKGPDGRIGIRHQTELFGHFNCKAAALIVKLWGMTVDAAAKSALEQIETFFSGMAWYLTEHPGWGQKLFDPAKTKDKEQIKQCEPLLKELAELDKAREKPRSSPKQ